jgi:hypothetical protein
MTGRRVFFHALISAFIFSNICSLLAVFCCFSSGRSVSTLSPAGVFCIEAVVCFNPRHLWCCVATICLVFK